MFENAFLQLWQKYSYWSTAYLLLKNLRPGRLLVQSSRTRIFPGGLGRGSAGEFFYISKLVSFVIKAEGVTGYRLGRPEANPSATAAWKARLLLQLVVDLESNLNREFVSQGRELGLSNPVLLSREACHADPNRARPPFPGAPVASDVLASREHVVGRAGCTGARLVGEVKDHFRLTKMV
jgi:hypothetical protein